MIELLLACTMLQAPLALSGDESGVWFIGDINPTQATFSGLPLDLDYELCERVSKEQYEVMQLFTRRPLAIAIDKKTMWYIDGTTGIGLYKLQFSVHTKSALRPSILEAFIETPKEPTDFLLFDGVPTVAFGGSQNDVLELLQYRERTWESLPSLQGKYARILQVQEQLIAAVPSDSGVVMWSLNKGKWNEGDEFSLEGKLVQLVNHDDWPILVTAQDDKVTLRGIQRGCLVEIASFATPKGRWGVSSSKVGITVIGVQRKGTITLLDIGWPSGSVSEPIILQERKRAGNTMVTTLLFVSMLAVSLFLILRIRATMQKPA